MKGFNLTRITLSESVTPVNKQHSVAKGEATFAGLSGLADEVEFGWRPGALARWASPVALGGGATEYDERDAAELGGRWVLVQHEQSEGGPSGTLCLGQAVRFSPVA